MRRRQFLHGALALGAATASIASTSTSANANANTSANAKTSANANANANPAIIGGPSPWSSTVPAATLTPAQSRAFRAWMVRMIAAQFTAGPTPRWQQRDCVGLVRFAVAEALREHDLKWKRANGLAGRPTPPEIGLAPGQSSLQDLRHLRHNWRLADGSHSAYASALELVQGNTRFMGKDCNLAQAGDLLFFDQGDAQHLMVWMGSFIAYHTGTVTRSDNGLRSLSLRDLQHWHDTRWHPSQDNPNFAGVYRLLFLSA
jgi:uncharacterized protein YfaT (DUF1175 family)